MVAGDHLHRDTRRVAGGDGGGRGRAWGIEHRLQSRQGQILQRVGSEPLRIGPGADRRGQHPQTTGAQRLRGSEDAGAVQQLGLAVGAKLIRAPVQDTLDGPLDQNDVPAVGIAVQGGHELALGTERDDPGPGEC